MSQAFICPRCATPCWHPLEIYFRWCPKCQAVTGTPRPCPHPQPVSADRWRIINAEQDTCMIAIENRNPLPTKALKALPPWRAVTMARVAALTNLGLQDGTLEQLTAEARRVRGDGQLGDWWLKEVPA